ncbi:MAG: hypothetical protein ACYDH9_24295 [Limisphaerales bacterium]
MSGEWRLVFDEDAFEYLLSRRARERNLLIAFLEKLKVDPYQEGEYTVEDDSGRPLQVKGFQPYLITYWLDHSVKEVRVLDIERIRS